MSTSRNTTITKSLFLPLCGAVLFTGSLAAQERHDDRHDDRHHIEDKHHHDYHDFNDHENRAWQIYWQQQHRKEIDWDRASARQRQAYWDWRHNHSDSILQINIR